MNAIHVLAAQEWVEQLGWTLIHFLWQGVLISALYAVTRRRLLRSSSPNTRYFFACGALAAMTIAPIMTLSLMQASNPASASPGLIGHLPSTAFAFTTIASSTIRVAVPGVRSVELLPWVVLVWIAGSVAFWFRLLGGWVIAARMRSLQVRTAPPQWQQVVTRLGTRIGISRPVRLLVSAVVQVPTVVGWLRPVVLVPIGALAGLPPEYMEALLIHELAHVRRHDYLVNMMQSGVEALLFYHPAVWWVSGHIRLERELCCDDIAVLLTGDVFTYASALAELESSRPAHFSAAVAADGSSLADRIGRLLGHPQPMSRTFAGPGIIVSTLLVMITVFGIIGQSAAQPRFAFAAITPNFTRGLEIQGAKDFHTYLGRLVAKKALLGFLVQKAYAVEAFQIGEGPDWMSSAHFDVEAEAKNDTSAAELSLMLQSLLADRFKLRVHRETQVRPVYKLTVAEGGARLPLAKEDGCRMPTPNSSITLPPSPPPEGQPFASTPPEIFREPVRACGRFFLTLNSTSTAKLVAARVSMTELARYFSTILGVTVIDKTGLVGTFDAQMSFVPDAALALIRGSQHALRPADVVGGTIFAALQEQLGLKLDSGKGPVDVLVIDHAEQLDGQTASGLSAAVREDAISGSWYRAPKIVSFEEVGRNWEGLSLF